MGNVESNQSSAPNDSQSQPSAPNDSQSQPSAPNDSQSQPSAPNDSQSQPSAPLDSLLAEAAAFGGDENESLDAKSRKALECPCIAHLRSGPCGTQFSEAFRCYLKSTAEEKGSDCVHPFVALQKCIKANPDAFSKDVLDDDDEVKKEAEPAEEYKIIPPIWAAEKGQKQKL